MTKTPDRLQDGTIDYAREYDNSGRVAEAVQLIEAYTTRAAAFRAQTRLDIQADRVYGSAERNRLDIVWPDDERGKRRRSPLAMFIHGGYWQRLDRRDFTHLAGGLVGNGVAVALPSYTLCPNIAIGGIINELRRACVLLWQTHRRPLTVVGHSAGGHLAAAMLTTDWSAIHEDLPPDLVASGMGISGLYDLSPLRHTPLNGTLRMSEDEASRWSPVRQVPPALHRFEAWVGADESAEYHRQSADLARRWSMLGTPTSLVSVERANHFTVVEPLTDPDSTMVRTILDLIDEPSPKVQVAAPDEAEVAALMQNLSAGASLPDEETEDGQGEEEPADAAEEDDPPPQVGR